MGLKTWPNLAFGLARLEHTPSAVWQAAVMKRFRLHHSPDPVFQEAWFRAATRRITNFMPTTLLLALRSLAELQLSDLPPPGKFIVTMLDRSQGLLRSLNADECSALLWSLVALRVKPNERWMDALMRLRPAAVCMQAWRVVRRYPQPPALSDLALALARLRYQPSEEWAALVEAQTGSELAGYEVEQLAVLCWAWGNVELEVPAAWQAVLADKASSQQGSRVFLDIDIGDPAEYAEQLAQYTRAGEYLASVGMQLGLPQQAPESMDEEQQQAALPAACPTSWLRLQLLLEAYSADRQWSSKGPAACIKPVPLRAGRLVIQLMEAECPRTCANFKALATGEKGVGKASKKPLHYKGNRIHRIVKSFCAQGGDIVRGDGSGGDSIYGGVFNDEKKGLGMKHDRLGVVAMANSGKNSNTSQFFITLGPAPQCDGKHVVFGMVVEGMEVLHRLNHVSVAADEEAASEDGTPRVVVTVADCGLC
ncbi:hypothetical protein QJQ45_021668 [Haematococcus lacustris]|nr:hypothetical protein QJQ45_021668 [Haematococcus lacustris]